MDIISILQMVVEVGVTTTVTVLTLWFGCRYINLKFENYKKKTQDALIRKPLEHNFFVNINNVLNNKIDNMNIIYKGKLSKGRKKLFQDMLRIKLGKRRENIVKSIIKIQSGDYTNDEERDIMLNAFYQIVKDYEEAWQNEGIQDVIIEKFRKWHSYKCDMTIEYIQDTYSGNCFSSSIEKLNCVLMGYNTLLFMTIFDAERSLGELNGTLSGKKYKGLTIE